MYLRRPVVLSMALYLLFAGVLSESVAAEGGDTPPEPVTTSDPSIPTDELALLLRPLSKDELLVEAGGWQEIVKAKAEEIARAEIAVRRENKEIAKAEAIKKKAQEARGQLALVAERVGAARATGDADKIAEAQRAASEARDIMHEVSDIVDETIEAARKTAEMRQEMYHETWQKLDETAMAAKKAKQAVSDVQAAVDGAEGKSDEDISKFANRAQQATDAVQQKIAETLAEAVEETRKAAALDEAAEAIALAEEVNKAEKIGLLEAVTIFREERTLLLDNMRAVIDELQAKTDVEDADTMAKIRDYRLYLSGVSGINIDVTDTISAWVSLKGWIVSTEGGLRWLVNIGTFVGILVLAWFLSRLLSSIMRKTTGRMAMPALLADFLNKTVRWVVMIIGTIWALSALEVSVAPLLAMVGAAGFIIAFAMQDSLSNFASGLMILFFRPFDMGDLVEAGGVVGKVNSMNLVSTTIRTLDNKLMVVPNSKIWSDVITNVTGVTERRVDMEFGLGYDDDVDRTQQILEEIVSGHPKVLKTPPPTIKMSALADSSVNFICRPWTRPGDYWDVYWDVTRDVKKRFDAAGIGIPYPQRDVHLYVQDGSDNGRVAAHRGKAERGPRSGQEGDRSDGGLET